MSIRKYSMDYQSDDNDKSVSNELNKAILMSDSQSLLSPKIRKKISSPKKLEKMSPGWRKMETKTSKPKMIIADEILLEPKFVIVETKKLDLCDDSTTDDNIDEKKNSYLSEIEVKNEDFLEFRNFDPTIENSTTIENFQTNILEKSDIWPALTALDSTFSIGPGNSDKNNEEIIENLNEKFSYSPRQFTETLLTIIEESMMDPEDESDGLNNFLKMALNEGSKNLELLDEISTPNLVISQSSKEFSSNYSSDSKSDSTKYLSYKKITSPKIHRKMYRRSIRLEIGRESPVEIQNSNEIIEIESSTKTLQNFCNFSKNRKTPQKSLEFPLKLGITYEKSPKIRKNKINISSELNKIEGKGEKKKYPKSPGIKKKQREPPKISVCPPTPNFHMENRKLSYQGSDDDEYLTAESEIEEPEVNNYNNQELISSNNYSEKSMSFEAEEPIACSSKKLNISSIAHHHQQWVQAYEKASEYGSKIYRTTTTITKTKDVRMEKLENCWLEKLRKKRQECLDLVDQLVQKDEKIDLSSRAQQNHSSCKITREFVSTLRACSEYLACSKNVKNGLKQKENSSGYISGLSTKIAKSKDSTVNYLAVHQRKSRSPRKSFGKKKLRIMSPGAKSLSPYSKSLSPFSKSSLTKKSLKGLQSPRIDRSSLKPVSQLLCLFSPGKRAAAGIKSNKNVIRGPIELSPLGERNKHREKFKHVISPVGQYIRGNKAT